MTNETNSQSDPSNEEESCDCQIGWRRGLSGICCLSVCDQFVREFPFVEDWLDFSRR